MHPSTSCSVFWRLSLPFVFVKKLKLKLNFVFARSGRVRRLDNREKLEHCDQAIRNYFLKIKRMYLTGLSTKKVNYQNLSLRINTSTDHQSVTIDSLPHRIYYDYFSASANI